MTNFFYYLQIINYWFMKKYFILTACITAFFVSCQSKNPLIFETREVDFINQTGDVIKGEYLELDVIQAVKIKYFFINQ